MFDQALSELREAGLIPDSFQPTYHDFFVVGVPTGDPKLPSIVGKTYPRTLEEARQELKDRPGSRIYSGLNRNGPGGVRIYRSATLPGKFGGAGPFDAVTKTKLTILHEYAHEKGGFGSEADINAWALKQLGLP